VAYVTKQVITKDEYGEKLDPICIHRSESFCEGVAGKMYDRALREVSQ